MKETRTSLPNNIFNLVWTPRMFSFICLFIYLCCYLSEVSSSGGLVVDVRSCLEMNGCGATTWGRLGCLFLAERSTTALCVSESVLFGFDALNCTLKSLLPGVHVFVCMKTCIYICL